MSTDVPGDGAQRTQKDMMKICGVAWIWKITAKEWAVMGMNKEGAPPRLSRQRARADPTSHPHIPLHAEPGALPTSRLFPLPPPATTQLTGLNMRQLSITQPIPTQPSLLRSSQPTSHPCLSGTRHP